MDYHAKEKQLYIADSQKLTIERQKLDDGTREEFLSKGAFTRTVWRSTAVSAAISVGSKEKRT
jgi:hypothetical protein